MLERPYAFDENGAVYFKPLPDYRRASEARRAAAATLRPPQRITVSQAAEKFRRLNNPGSYTGPWRNDRVPYMVEPMDMLTSRRHRAVAFVGPSQSGKTDGLVINWQVYTVCCDPADMQIVQIDMNQARDFARRRIDRLHRDSPEVGRRLGPQKTDDNLSDKRYRGGMLVSMSWPSVSQLSSRSIPRMAMTDYDRYDDNIEGEGAAFDLGLQRIKTFGSRGMLMVESSPGRPIRDAKWKRPKGSHALPPAGGIVEIYNRGDRRRWYWPCPQCGEYFEGRFDALRWDDDAADIADKAASVVMVCPANGCVIEPRHRAAMNAGGIWVPEGQRVNARGRLTGKPRGSDIASYSLSGTAAAFQTWGEIVANYLSALDSYERLGLEESLQTVTNTELGEPYLPRALAAATAIDAEVLKARAEDYPLGTVPEGVRLLIVAVDVQKNRFVYQVEGYGPGLERWVVDRGEIVKSSRRDEDGDPLPLDPGSYAEDWRLLNPLFARHYPLGDGSGRTMTPALVVVDSGGASGTTDNAYKYWRHAKRHGRHRRLMLVKGDGYARAPRIKRTYPESARADRKASARGEVPVYRLNVNLLKDTLDGYLRREKPGPGYIHTSRDLDASFFEEWTAETKTDKGWTNPSRLRNESWDLSVYSHAGAIELKLEKLAWANPPPFAAPWDDNANVHDAPTDDGDDTPDPDAPAGGKPFWEKIA